MTQQINGQLGDWAFKCAKAKPIEVWDDALSPLPYRRRLGGRRGNSRPVGPALASASRTPPSGPFGLLRRGI